MQAFYWPANTLAISKALSLVACGASESSRSRGELITVTSIEQHAVADISQLAGAAGLPAHLASAVCSVRIDHVLYATRDPHGQEAAATAAVMAPIGSAPACSGPRPVLLWAHGTTPLKSHNRAAPR